MKEFQTAKRLDLLTRRAQEREARSCTLLGSAKRDRQSSNERAGEVHSMRIERLIESLRNDEYQAVSKGSSKFCCCRVERNGAA